MEMGTKVRDKLRSLKNLQELALGDSQGNTFCRLYVRWKKKKKKKKGGQSRWSQQILNLGRMDRYTWEMERIASWDEFSNLLLIFCILCASLRSSLTTEQLQ